MKKSILFLGFLTWSVICFPQDTLILYLDKSFMQTDVKDAEFIREVTIVDNHYNITDKNINGQFINYCEYASVDPWIEDGYAMHFTMPDILYSTGKYNQGRITGQWLYYGSANCVDTVYYSLPEDYIDLNNCPQKNPISLDQVTDSRIPSIISSLNRYLTDNYHLPSRAIGDSASGPISISFILDMDARIKCLKFKNLVHEDVKCEIYRILSQYRSTVVLDEPVTIDLDYEAARFSNDQEEYVIVDEMPQFFYDNCIEDGVTCFYKYIQDKIVRKYSSKCSGKAFIILVIGKEGEVEDLRITEGLIDCDVYLPEIERIIKNSPKWTPGRMNGTTVKVRFSFPLFL